MEGLENEAQLVPAQAGERVIVKSVVAVPVQRQPTAVGAVYTGNEVEQRGFANTLFADDGDVLARYEAQGDVV